MGPLGRSLSHESLRSASRQSPLACGPHLVDLPFPMVVPQHRREDSNRITCMSWIVGGRGRAPYIDLGATFPHPYRADPMSRRHTGKGGSKAEGPASAIGIHLCAYCQRGSTKGLGEITRPCRCSTWHLQTERATNSNRIAHRSLVSIAKPRRDVCSQLCALMSGETPPRMLATSPSVFSTGQFLIWGKGR
jgi:hypothetical protein